jgi:hypothetical protein
MKREDKMYISRRDFIKTGAFFCLSSMLGCSTKIMKIAASDENEFQIIPAKYIPKEYIFQAKNL